MHPRHCAATPPRGILSTILHDYHSDDIIVINYLSWKMHMRAQTTVWRDLISETRLNVQRHQRFADLQFSHPRSTRSILHAQQCGILIFLYSIIQ